MWTVWLWFQEIGQLLKYKFLWGQNIPRATSPGLTGSVVHLTMLIITTYRRLTWQLVRNELEDMWKEVVVAEFKVLYRNLLEGTDDKFPVCTLFLNTLGLCSVLHLRFQASHPYKVTGNSTLLLSFLLADGHKIYFELLGKNSYWNNDELIM